MGAVEHALLLGAEYISTSNDNDRYKAVTSSNYSISNLANFSGSFDYTDLNDDTEADLDVVSVFIQDTISLSDSLDVILGGRFDRFDLSVDNVKTLRTVAAKTTAISASSWFRIQSTRERFTVCQL